MAARFQLVIHCADPEPLARFWAAALGYESEPGESARSLPCDHCVNPLPRASSTEDGR